MEVSIEQRQHVRPPVVSGEESPGQETLRIVDGGDVRVEPDARRYSFSADCECPDDCLRDHANE